MINMPTTQLNHYLPHLHLVLTNWTLFTRPDVFTVLQLLNLLLRESLRHLAYLLT
jgi:hypothetical protein